MPGKNWVCSVVIVCLLLFPSLSLAQQCKFPEEQSETYILIDGVTYEYLTIEDSKKRFVEVIEGRAAKQKVEELNAKIQKLEERDAGRLDRIALMDKNADMDQQMILELLDTDPVPLFKKPVFNFAAGLVVTGALFIFWGYSQGNLNNL